MSHDLRKAAQELVDALEHQRQAYGYRTPVGKPGARTALDVHMHAARRVSDAEDSLRRALTEASDAA